jgi:hypothetical protein
MTAAGPGYFEMFLDSIAHTCLVYACSEHAYDQVHGCDLFAGALEMMILQSLRRQPAHITPSGLGPLDQDISSFEHVFKGISFVLDPGKSIAT